MKRKKNRLIAAGLFVYRKSKKKKEITGQEVDFPKCVNIQNAN